MGWGIGIMVWITARIAAWPDATLRIPPMPDAAILLMAAGLIWLCIWRSAARYGGILLLLAGLGVYAAAPPPDVLVSADARLIAIRAAPGDIFLVAGRHAAYTLAQWAPVWGRATLTPAICLGDACRVGGRKILFVQGLPVDCSGAALIVSPIMLRGACGDTPVIDRFSVYENGATAAWVGRSLRVVTDREVQGNRPWVQAYPPQNLYIDRGSAK
jgi:competence protein ComEC